METKIATAAHPEAGWSNKVIFIPDHIRDSEYVNTAFAGIDGSLTPNLEKPLAQFNIEYENKIPKLVINPLDEYGEALKAFADAKKRAGGNVVRATKELATAGIVDSNTIDATKSLNILDRVLGLQVRDFFLMNTVTLVPSPNLVFTVDTYTEGSVQEKVPELDEPDLITHTESRATKILYKNIGHIAISEEADLKGSHPTMQLRQEKTIKDLARSINSQLATELETATGVGGADWGAVSGTPADSSNNPINDIEGVMTTIEGNGFNTDYIAAHNRPATDLTTNKFIRGRGNEGVGTNVLLSNQINEMGIPAILKDQALTNTVAIVGSKDATWLGQGPTAVASYINDQAGYKGWLAKQWWFPFLSQAGGIRKLTAVSA